MIIYSMPRYKIERTAILSEQEVLDMTNAASKLRDKAMVSFLWLYGCRPSEMFNIKREDFWIQNDELWISIETKKTRRKVGKDIIPIMKRNLKAPFNQFTYLIQQYIDSQSYNLPLFRYGSNTNSHVANMNRILKGINSSVCPYLFRHTRNTILAECGATESMLVAWNGWSDGRPSSSYVKHTKRLIDAIPMPKPVSNMPKAEEDIH